MVNLGYLLAGSGTTKTQTAGQSCEGPLGQIIWAGRPTLTDFLSGLLTALTEGLGSHNPRHLLHKCLHLKF